MKTLDAQTQREIRRGVVDIIPEQEFWNAFTEGRRLRLKLGLDPSKPDLHIGHGVLLRKLRLLQELGHQVVLIVGDWTAQIGDPSGQSIMRPMLTAEEVAANARTYMEQFFHIVDRGQTEVRWQSEWFNSFSLADVVRLAGRFTVAQMLQREDFRQRYEAQKPLGVHELLYPLLQAYDSVVIESDVEFGGTDQLFNLLVGRELQEQVGQRPQVCITMRLLVGIDGQQKMSKSLGNTIDFEDPPFEKYGKVMSIPDAVVADYLDLATVIPDEEVSYFRRQVERGGGEAMEVKKRLAREIVTQFHGIEAAEEAGTQWVQVFSAGAAPDQAPSYAVPQTKEGPLVIDLPEALVETGLAVSKAEARRLIRQGGIEVDGRKVSPEEAGHLLVAPEAVLRVGRHRFLRIVRATEGNPPVK
jgi:tyrosyl-tRNA synthetase